MTASGKQHDDIFASPHAKSDFVFDEKVAAVFTDMINRSVPGYATILSMIGVLAARYGKPGSNIYDLGCSLGLSAVCHRQFRGHGHPAGKNTGRATVGGIAGHGDL